MKKGISIWSFSTNDLKTVFKKAKDAGYEGVELEIAEEGLIRPDSTDAELDEAKRIAAESGLELYSIASGLYWKYSITSDDKEQREHAKYVIKRHLYSAARLGCKTILVVPGMVEGFDGGEAVDYDVAYNRAFEVIKELAPYAESVGVELALENVWNHFLLSPLETRDFIDKIGSDYVGAYFDVGNVLATGRPEQWIKILGNRIKKVHIKDFKRSIGNLEGFVDLMEGDVDWKAVMAAFKRIGYDGWITAEMCPLYKNFPDGILYTTSIAMDMILGRR